MEEVHTFPTKAEVPLKVTMWSWHECHMAESERVDQVGGGRYDRRGRQGLDPEVMVGMQDFILEQQKNREVTRFFECLI